MKSEVKKKNLKKDSVTSNTFHVGIELELKAPGEQSGHDYDACHDAQREYMDGLSDMEILRDYVGLSKDDARFIERYFNTSDWVRDYMESWDCNGDCDHYTSDAESTRDLIENDLIDLTGNASIKVVSDGSIDCNENEVDAEVCWNYFAVKETIKDNTTILNYLKKNNCTFDKSCGLHINLNNYLNLEFNESIDTSKLDFLFNFVAASRRSSSYCNRYAIANEKYSMIFHQGDRLEFRFFSPTLEAEKLNHYVSLANVIYRRLCGVNAKLSKKSMNYFLNKMTKVNGINEQAAIESLKKVNSLYSYAVLSGEEAMPEKHTRKQLNLDIVA